jgi:hypothetical protein
MAEPPADKSSIRSEAAVGMNFDHVTNTELRSDIRPKCRFAGQSSRSVYISSVAERGAPLVSIAAQAAQ